MLHNNKTTTGQANTPLAPAQPKLRRLEFLGEAMCQTASGVRSGHMTSLDSNESGRPFSSSGAGQLRPVTGVPSTIAGVTDEKLDGYATVHIVLGLGGEHAAAEPASRDRASHRRFFFSVSVHAFSLRPTEGESPIRKDPRGDLTGEGRSGTRGRTCATVCPHRDIMFIVV